MQRNKYELLLKNSLWGSGSFVFITLISFLMLPYIVAKLSVEGYGIYILITSLIGYYGILDLGLGNALIKYVAEFYEKKQIELLNDYINSAVVFQTIVGIIASGMIIIFSNGIITLLNIDLKEWNTARTALNLAALGFFFTFIGGAYKSVLQGLQLFKFTSIIDSVFILLLNISLLIVLYSGFGLIGAITVNVIIAMFSFAMYFFTMRKNLISYKIKVTLNLKIIMKIFNFSIFVFLSKISNIFATYVVRFVISFFWGPSAVTYYVVPSKLLGAVGGIASSAAAVLFPFSSQLSATNDSKEIKQLFLKSSKIFAALLTPIVIFIFIFSKQILTIWMGIDFAEKSWFVLSIISFSALIASFSAIPNLIVLGQGDSKLIGVFSLVTIILYLIFTPVLTYLFDINGTAISLIIASTGVIFYVIYKTSKLLKVKISDYYIVVLKPHIMVLILSVIILSVNVRFKVDNIFIMTLIGLTSMMLHYVFLVIYNIIPLKNIYQTLNK